MRSGDPAIERVTVVKPVRVGATTLLTGAIANFVCNDPTAILALLPTKSDARNYMISNVRPILAASAITELDITGPQSGDRSTILHRLFPGGSLKVVAARAPPEICGRTPPGSAD